VQRFIPERRFGRPEEITAAILFAASPEASYLNGSIIEVNGGLGAAEAGPVRD
jgi:NAD(P)-dependent dehydrogenase (short-subunit alcohol dehydrogenase family)